MSKYSIPSIYSFFLFHSCTVLSKESCLNSVYNEVFLLFDIAALSTMDVRGRHWKRTLVWYGKKWRLCWSLPGQPGNELVIYTRLARHIPWVRPTWRFHSLTYILYFSSLKRAISYGWMLKASDSSKLYQDIHSSVLPMETSTTLHCLEESIFFSS